PLAREDEEVLLRTLAVVETRRLAGLEYADVDPELRERRLAFEDRSRAELLVLEPPCLFRVDDEPAVSLRDEAAGFGLLQGCLGNHPHLQMVECATVMRAYGTGQRTS